MGELTRADALVPRIAEELGLRIVAPLSGGEFGATLVADGDGRELVLKVMASPAMAPEMARGAADGGAAAGARVSRSALRGDGRRVRGIVVAAGAASGRGFGHADGGARAAARRAGGDARGGGGRARRLGARARATAARGWARTAAEHEASRAMGAELEAIVECDGALELFDDSVMHCDFHHRNYLAEGDVVTGVFDWEIATAGDWRFDLFTLAFWTTIYRTGIEREARELITARLHEVCPPAVLAFFSACQSLRQIDFDGRMHPERLGMLVEAIERRIGPWWRGGVMGGSRRSACTTPEGSTLASDALAVVSLLALALAGGIGRSYGLLGCRRLGNRSRQSLLGMSFLAAAMTKGADEPRCGIAHW